MIDITVNVDEKLSLNKFNVDEENAHIKIKKALRLPILNSRNLLCAAQLHCTRCPQKATSQFLTTLVASNVVRAA